MIAKLTPEEATQFVRQVQPDLEEFGVIAGVGVEQREHLGVNDAATCVVLQAGWPGKALQPDHTSWSFS